MKILDKYILKNVFLPVVFCSYTLILLFLIADVFDHLSEILSNKTPILTVLRYYSLLIPYAFSQTISWAMLLGCIYVFTTFTKHHELVAMKATGLDIVAIATPIVFTGFCLSIITFIINDRVVPPTFRLSQEIKEAYIKTDADQRMEQTIENITLLTDNAQFYVKSMDTKTNEISDVRVHYLDEAHDVAKRIVAKKGTWNNNIWTLHQVSIYDLDAQKRIIGEPHFYPERTFPNSPVRPQDFISANKSQMVQSINEIKATAKRLRRNGLDDRSEQVDYHDRIANPWMNLIIILLLLPFLARTNVRKGMVISIVLCILVVFGYTVVNAFVLALGKKGILAPVISAWAAHALFAGTALFFMKEANH
ncbi:MAG: LptF/LptG family permease [Candidatus Omnitrophica bacterium]|nr:LptF/LptG family permease [Candidatus Omnitrophota bacterium]